MGFDSHVKAGEVKAASRDPALARSLLGSAKERMETIALIPLNSKSSSSIFELAYDSIREPIDAILALDGYKSYSHIASISYLARFREITTAERNRIDNARHKRNQSKYYGKRVEEDETRELLLLADSVLPKLELIIGEKLRKP
jgi:hypothetical protein